MRRPILALLVFAACSLSASAARAAGGALWVYGTDGTQNTGLLMKPGTSPAITLVPGVGYEVAFQGVDGHLSYYGDGHAIQTGLTMDPGSSPALSSSLTSSGFETAVQASTHELWTGADGGLAPAGVQLEPGTSPSVATLSDGSHEFAYEGDNTGLYIGDGSTWTNTFQGMNTHSSPSIGASNQGGWQAMFEANTDILYDWSSSSGGGDTKVPLAGNTSPGIVGVQDGGYELVFQENTSDLIAFGNAGGGDSHEGMLAGSSPTVTYLPGNGYESAFQANTGILYTYGTGGNVDTGLPMEPGTSPSITTVADGYEVAFQGPPPVQSTPQTVTSPSPRAGRHKGRHRRLKVRVTMRWTWDYGRSTLHRVRLLGRLPRGTALTVACAGHGCPARLKRISHRRRPKLVLHELAGLRFRAGDRLVISVGAPRYASERVGVTIRYGQKPSAKLIRS